MDHLLFLVHRIPYPPNKGDKIRSYHLLRHLVKHFHVHLATFVDDPNDVQYIDTVRALCASSHFAMLSPRAARVRSLGALAGGRALSIDYYRDAGMQAWIGRLLASQPVERVLVFSSAMAQYADHPALRRRVIDFVDVDSDKWLQYAQKKVWPMSWLYRRESRQLLRYEREVAARFDASLFVSQPEAELFRRLAPAHADKIGYFSNGVDTDYFSPAHALADPYPADQHAIVFTGAMDYWPNVDAVQWFADEIFPQVRARHAHAHFYIVGSRPTGAVQQLARLPGVHVTGTVPDVRPYLAHARLAVAPLRVARGIQNKVLEAMAMARPVLVSPQALEGISAVPGEELMVADDSAQFAALAVRLLEQQDTLGMRARQKVVALYGWDNKLALLDTLLESEHAAHFS